MRHLLVKKLFSGQVVAMLFLALSTWVAVGMASASMTPAQAETRWVSDVPIMDELEIIVDLGFSFDSPNGRIIGIFATSNADMSMVKGFYDKALQALGWAWQNDSWYRGSERLSLTRADTSFGSVWRLMVQPR
ncbi:hypothetical protein [Candidatus Puniceispirillum marinum]|uniref:Uncharacterized protein n=1 Tax=Puniceispirillum marinum (strain IMCC1322) TaxID=488538 RepID=D5BU57_PUNMI|nr:hypothetical protein [Candidatus Puniceispirillum marinum]ADE39804.1 hypothetical protein SAR116_1561 [Candidatus Puniceispirillum marinum IMCC1322]